MIKEHTVINPGEEVDPKEYELELEHLNTSGEKPIYPRSSQYAQIEKGSKTTTSPPLEQDLTPDQYEWKAFNLVDYDESNLQPNPHLVFSNYVPIRQESEEPQYNFVEEIDLMGELGPLPPMVNHQIQETEPEEDSNYITQAQ